MTRTSSQERRFWNKLTIFLALPFALTANFLSALWIMLALGVAHSEWPVIPAFGYWPTYVLLAGATSLIGALKPWRTNQPKDQTA